MTIQRTWQIVALLALGTTAIGAWTGRPARVAVDECNGYCEICNPGAEEEEYSVVGTTTEPDAIFDVSVYCSQHYIGNCGFFSNCDPPGAPSPLAFTNAAGQNDMKRLKKLLSKYEKFAYLAPERGAIQLIGCNDQVKQQIRLTEEQTASLLN